jgi:hypothetical protein
MKVVSEKEEGFTIHISMASAPEMVTQPSFTSAVRQALMWHFSWSHGPREKRLIRPQIPDRPDKDEEVPFPSPFPTWLTLLCKE